MKNFKLLWGFLAVFILNGCMMLSNQYYILSVASTPTHTYSIPHRIIGIEKISIPAYLYKREIAIAQSSSQITLLSNAQWGEDLDVGLTHRLISYLQKKFNQPDVYPYPWGLSRQADIKISVQITRFIAQGNQVYLDATWRIADIQSKKRKSKLFTRIVPIQSDKKEDASSIVDAMDRVFIDLEEDIANGVKHFK